MPLKYIGRQPHFHGRSIFEIARNLKNFGEGRIVYRANRKHNEYVRLSEVKPEMNLKGYFKGTAYGLKFLDGQQRSKTPTIIEVGYKQDWRLVPKDEEKSFLQSFTPDQVPEKPTETIPFYQPVPHFIEMLHKQDYKYRNMEYQKYLCKNLVRSDSRGKNRNSGRLEKDFFDKKKSARVQ